MADSANKQAVYWHFAAFLPKLRTLAKSGRQGMEDLKLIGQQASDVCGENPLHMITTPSFLVPALTPDKLTGPQVIAVMAGTIWVLCGEDTGIAGAMVNDWPDLPMYAILAGENAMIADKGKEPVSPVATEGREGTWKKKPLIRTVKR